MQEGVPMQRLQGLQCYDCAIGKKIRRRKYDAANPEHLLKDRERETRLGMDRDSGTAQCRALLMTGFDFLDTTANDPERFKLLVRSICGPLDLKHPDRQFMLSQRVHDHLFDLLSPIPTRRGRWTALRDVLVALCASPDLPCKWRLGGTAAPTFHNEAVLDKCPWWFNAAKRARSPLGILLILGAAIGRWSDIGAGVDVLQDLLIWVHHIDQVWYNGSGQMFLPRFQ